MSYKPKYCCQCGDKIERADWNFLTSRRFCELCETNFRHLDWMPKAFFASAAILTIFSLGLFFQKPEKTLVVSSNQPQNFLSNANQNSVSTNSALKQTTNSTISQQANDNLTMPPKSAADTTTKQAEKIKSTDIQTNVAAEETVYFCGAQTKKGTPCTRHVKLRGARCWQHPGQAAMMPPDKLIAN